MHPVLHSFAAAALLFAATPLIAEPPQPVRPSGLTIVMDFRGPHSDGSVAAKTARNQGRLQLASQVARHHWMRARPGTRAPTYP